MTHTAPVPQTERLYLLYHELRSEESRYSYAMSAHRFAAQIEFFARLHRWHDALLRPEITFDDGHRSDLHIAMPLLTLHGVHAAFFITAGWLNQRAGYMTGGELRELHRAGHIIGAHGWSHTLLTQCSATKLHSELADSRKLLEDELGAAVDIMSLPGGRGNRRVFAAANEVGYRQIYTSTPGPEADPSAARIGRLNLRGDTTLSWISDLFAPDRKLLKRLRREDQLKQVAKRLLGDTLYERLWRIANRAEDQPGQIGAGSL